MMRPKQNISENHSGGIVYASEEARTLLERNRILDADQFFSLGEPVYQRHKGRCVCEAVLKDERGISLKVFIKTHQGRVRFPPRMTELKEKQVFGTLPEREWKGIGRLEAAGMHVPQRLALFREGLFVFRAGIVLREIPPPQSIDQMLENGSWQHLSQEQQGTLLDEVIATMQKIHAAGLIWRGASSRHFYPEWQSDGRCKLWLIDCEGVYARTSKRAIERNYLKLFRSMKESGADFTTLDRLRKRIETARSGKIRSAPLRNERDSHERQAA